MNESSGGINTDHDEITYGIHKGDSAIGNYGLMPNTIKEIINRMHINPTMTVYLRMNNQGLARKIKENRAHEKRFAQLLANRLHIRYNGDEAKMAYAWLNGHNLTNKHFNTTHRDYKNHHYVKKYFKHKSEVINGQ
jgi:hypothetical protein